MNHVSVLPTLHDRIVLAQKQSKGIQVIKEKVAQKDEKYRRFRVDWKGVVWFEGRIVVRKDHDLRKKILDEAHLSKFSIHPGSNKMYQDLRENFW